MKVLFVEDHPIVVSGCRQLFARKRHTSFVHAATVREARAKLKEFRPDVVLVDVNLPDGSGLDFVRELSALRDEPKIVVFSLTDDPAFVLSVLDCGADGFVSKSDSPEMLLRATQTVMQDETWLSDELVQAIALIRALPGNKAQSLTKRQKDIMKLLASGFRMAEIASKLNTSAKIVSAECAALRRMLNARTNTEMLFQAAKSNLG